VSENRNVITRNVQCFHYPFEVCVNIITVLLFRHNRSRGETDNGSTVYGSALRFIDFHSRRVWETARGNPMTLGTTRQRFTLWSPAGKSRRKQTTRNPGHRARLDDDNFGWRERIVERRAKVNAKFTCDSNNRCFFPPRRTR